MNKQYTFLKLLEEYKVEIPLLQRDYAQGRSDRKSESVRHSFVSALFDALTKEPKKIELDFIYGPIKENEESGKTFIPLDGQQRLTTLFLLHWYIAKRKGEDEETLKKFSYKVRTTTQEFLNALLDKERGGKLTLSDQGPKSEITDAAWYYSAWDVDPSVQGMLTMLDAIHKEYEKRVKNGEGSEFWNELNNISFYLLDMGEYGLSDDLYMKMNARGVPLTDFENFKAWLEKEVKTDIKLPEDWTTKLDTTWTDLFWKYSESNVEKFNKAYLRFFKMIALNAYVLKEKKKSDSDQIKRIHAEDKYIPNSDYAEVFELIEMETLSKAFIFLDEVDKVNWDKLDTQFFQFQNESPVQNLFECLCKKGEINYELRSLLYGAFLWITETEKRKDRFDDWMRVVRNLVINSGINNTNYASAINSLKSLFTDSQDDGIIRFLKTDHFIDFFNKKQVAEERLKASLIFKSQLIHKSKLTRKAIFLRRAQQTRNAKLIRKIRLIKIKENKFKNTIIEAENHACFRGRINFLLKKIENGKLEAINHYNLDLLKRNYKAAKLCWDSSGANENLFQALLSLDGVCFKGQINFERSRNNWNQLFHNEDIQRLLIKLFEKLNKTNNSLEFLRTHSNNDFKKFCKESPDSGWNYARIYQRECSNTQILDIRYTPQASTNKQFYCASRDELVREVFDKLKSRNLALKIVPNWKGDWDFSDKKNFYADWISVVLELKYEGNFAYVAFTTNGIKHEIGLRRHHNTSDEEHKKIQEWIERVDPESLNEFDNTGDKWWWYLLKKLNEADELTADKISEQLIALKETLDSILQKESKE